ncbi:hypothetical protein GGP66_000258 [Salinibacter ruber]|nr:hypothetical protein [Salinibacter ruber]
MRQQLATNQIRQRDCLLAGAPLQYVALEPEPSDEPGLARRAFPFELMSCKAGPQ